MPEQTDNNVDVHPTGIAALDTVLHGGIPRGATVLLSGGAGTGKTTLCNQWVFAGYDQYQEPALYLCMTESVARSLQNMRGASYFREEWVGQGRVHYEDIRGFLARLNLTSGSISPDDIDAIVQDIADLVLQSGARRVVIDSISALAYRFVEKSVIRQFIFQLGTALAYLDATVILTSEVLGNQYSVFGVEEFIVDGIIHLAYSDDHGMGTRTLFVRKMRSAAFESRPVSYRLSMQGFHLFPHMEAEKDVTASTQRVLTGTEGLNDMMDGGFLKGSSVIVSGAPGTGKSLLALQYLVNGLQQSEGCLCVSLEESHEQLLRNGAAFGWDLSSFEQENFLQIMACQPTAQHLDELVTQIRSVLNTGTVHRLVIDSLTALSTVFSLEDVRSFAYALMQYCRARDITLVMTHTTPHLFGAKELSDSALFALADQIIMLRYVEIESAIRHAALILKMRGSSHQKSLRELTFTDTGVAITTDFSGYEGIMSGVTRKVSTNAEQQLSSLFLEVLGAQGTKLFEQLKERGFDPDGVEEMVEQLVGDKTLSEHAGSEFLERIEEIVAKT